MWKIFCEYSDGSKATLTGKGEIDLSLAVKYHNQFINADKVTYQQYPKKDNEAKPLYEVIEELEEEYEEQELADEYEN